MLVPSAMFEENDSQVALITREENQKLSTDMLEENAALNSKGEPESAGTSGVSGEWLLLPSARQLHHWEGLHYVAREGGVQAACQGVLQSGEVLIETVSMINNVRINWIIVN